MTIADEKRTAAMERGRNAMTEEGRKEGRRRMLFFSLSFDHDDCAESEREEREPNLGLIFERKTQN